MDEINDWKKCALWLLECQVLPADHKLVSCPNANPKDLALYLRDGVILCLLLNKFEPGILGNKDFSQYPQVSQFLCTWNAKVFLQKCKCDFGLSDENLFEPCDLYQLTNFDKVLKTLSALSVSEKVSRCEIKPLLLNRNSVYDLRDLAETCMAAQENEEEPDNYVSEEDSTYQNMHDKSIYDDLCSIRHSMQQKMESDEAPKSKRDLCIQELVVTEKKYVEALRMIKLYFMKPLQKDLSPGDHKLIFYGIERLWQTHADFDISLRSAVKDTEMLIPDCFIANKEKFLFYGEFCSNLTTGQELLDKLIETNSGIKQRVRDCEISANEGKFKLRDLLALPMQRILKYHLFLKEIIKYTDDSHEKLMLEKALDEIQDLSLFINEVKRDNDTISSMQLVQSSIVNMPMSLTLKDCGRFIMDAELKLKSMPEHSVNTRQLFLFDMIILICKTKSDNSTYNYKGMIMLTEYELKEEPIKEKSMHGLQLTNKNNKSQYHVIYSKKVETRGKWFEAISLALENIRPPHAINELHEFTMSSFGKPTICDVCRKLLRGVFFQGYKCSKTKMAVHKNCLEGAKDMTGPPTGTLPPKSRRGGGHMSPVAPRSPRSPCSLFAGKVKAIESYDGSSPLDGDHMPLKFEVNDVIRVLPTSSLNCSGDTEWLEGELNGQRGVFPRKSVRALFQQQKSTPYETTTLQRSASSILPATPSPRSYPNFGRLSQASTNNSASNEIDADLATEDWYVSKMSRDDAMTKLLPTPEGTFLVRQSVDDSRRGEFALSMRINETVKHMKIGRNPAGEFFLSQRKIFKSVLELVSFYQSNSLESIFAEVTSTLVYPFYTVVMREGSHCICVAVFDYRATANNHLSLSKGDRIEIVSKAGDSLGWWKGRIGNRIGYFPVTYVKEI